MKRLLKVAARVSLLILLLLTGLQLVPQQRTTLAHGNGAPPGTEVDAHEMRLDAAYFESSGVVDQLATTPEGLILAPGAETGTYQTDAILSPLDYTTDVGLSWLADVPAGASVAVAARWSADGQSWGDWQAVPVEYYPIRDGEYAGALVWVDQATAYLQFRLSLQGTSGDAAPLFRRLRVFFGDSSQGPNAETAYAQALDAAAGSFSTACPAKPVVISRTGWGCPHGQSSPWWPPSYRSITHVVINHSATPNTADDWAEIVRAIWNYHTNTLGWGDVGYNYMIDPLGRIYEGRAGGDDVIGAFDGFNRGAMGIGYIGCYGDCDYLGIPNAAPSPAMMEAGNQLIAWKMGQKGIDPLGSGYYCEATLPNIVGRSDVTCRGGSLSPGDRLEAQITHIRSTVKYKIDQCQVPTATPSPTTTPGPTATPTPTPTPTATPTPTTPAPPPDEPTVRLSPGALQVAVGGTGNTAVEAANVSDLYGAQIRLSFDPGLVEVVDADPEADGVQVALGSVFDDVQFFVVQNEVSDGVVNFAATRLSPAPAFEGSGSLVEITWRGLAAGQSALTFDDVKLADPGGLPLSVEVQDGQVQVGSGFVLQGQARLQGRAEGAGITVSAGGSPVQTGPDGRFAILVQGPYELTLTAPGYLSARATGDTQALAAAGQSSLDLGQVMLLGGEVTGDEYIDILDLAFMANRYNGNDPLADINGDGLVDILDMTLAATNYETGGPVTDWQ